VLSVAHLRSNLLVKLGELTGETHTLPMVVYAPTARCNSRCLSCDWWRADGATDLTLDEVRNLAAALPAFGTKVVVLTGGEPLVRPDVMAIADLFRERGMVLHLLTSGLALERFAADIATRFVDVTISLDGHTPELYRTIRGVNGLDAVARGVAALRRLAPQVVIRARSTVHRHNFRFLGELVRKAREIGVDQISFLAADVSSEAFNRAPGEPPASGLLLTGEEVGELESAIESLVRREADAFAERRIVPGPEGLRRLARYFRAQLGEGEFPPVACNAPWTSVFIGADGTVRPCFFHPPVGNLRQRPLAELLTQAMPRFRRGLAVGTDEVCRRCVCSLKTGLRTRLW
jgi:MoaA/NifB/PqqE/SkfB family radical SAM enzyme